MLNGIGVDLGPSLESFLFDFVALLATLITSFIIDVVGSKVMWCISSFGLCVGLVIYATTLKIDVGNWIGTLGVFIYFLFYGLGEGPIPWCLGSTFF